MVSALSVRTVVFSNKIGNHTSPPQKGKTEFSTGIPLRQAIDSAPAYPEFVFDTPDAAQTVLIYTKK